MTIYHGLSRVKRRLQSAKGEKLQNRKIVKNNLEGGKMLNFKKILINLQFYYINFTVLLQFSKIY